MKLCRHTIKYFTFLLLLVRIKNFMKQQWVKWNWKIKKIHSNKTNKGTLRKIRYNIDEKLQIKRRKYNRYASKHCNKLQFFFSVLLFSSSIVHGITYGDDKLKPTDRKCTGTPKHTHEYVLWNSLKHINARKQTRHWIESSLFFFVEKKIE